MYISPTQTYSDALLCLSTDRETSRESPPRPPHAASAGGGESGKEETESRLLKKTFRFMQVLNVCPPYTSKQGHFESPIEMTCMSILMKG